MELSIKHTMLKLIKLLHLKFVNSIIAIKVFQAHAYVKSQSLNLLTTLIQSSKKYYNLRLYNAEIYKDPNPRL